MDTGDFTPRTAKRRLDVERLAMYALLTVSLAANVFFGLHYALERKQPVRPPLPLNGVQLPPLEVETIEGKRVTIAFDKTKKGTLVYLFAPNCSWCVRNVDNVRTLARAISAEYAVVGVSLSAAGLDDYLARNPLPFVVYRKPSSLTAKAYGMASTPTTYLVRADGALERTWLGAYVGKNASDVESAFGLKLPGVTQ